MRPIQKTLTTTGYTDWIPVDYTQNNFNVGVQIMPSVGADVIWSVQMTSDDVYTTLLPKWVPAKEPLKTGTGFEMGNINIPCRAIRLAATITSGDITITVIQGRK